MQDAWLLTQDGFDLATCRHFEALLAIGSGPLQQRAVLEEGLIADPQDVGPAGGGGAREPFRSRAGTFMPVVTAPHPVLGDELVNLPMIHALLLFCGSERLDVTASQVRAHRRRLDLRTGRLERTFIWDTAAGATLRVRMERFISAHRRHVMAIRCDVEHVAGPAVEVRIVATLDARVRTNGFDHFSRVEATGEHEPITLSVRTNSEIEVGAAALVTADRNIAWSVDAESRWAALSGGVSLQPGGRLTVAKFAAMTSSKHVAGSAVDAARKLAWDAAAAGFERLAAESDAVWASRWTAGDVEIDGAPDATLALRAAMYHMMRAAHDDVRAGVDPSGWTSEVTGGRVTWEQDMFLLPALLYTRPESGVALARHRLQSLGGAHRNAQREDYPGARYAWEATNSGDEGSSAVHARDHAVHVSADVAYGLWHVCVSRAGDVGMQVGATRALTEIARYWCSRVTDDASRGACELLMVMGPDEYKPFSRSNAYTAQMVRAALRAAVAAWTLLRELAPQEAARLRADVALTDDECAQFADLASRLRVPMDERRSLLLQSEDFSEYEPLALERVWPDRSQPLSSRIRLERLYRSQIIQKADAVLALALAPDDYTEPVQAATYDACEPRTVHAGTFSHGVHALVAARLGRCAEALAQWRRAVDVFLLPDATDGLRLAAGAALWHAVAFGFVGLRTCLQDELLTINPRLPDGWSSVRLRIAWRGAAIDVCATRDATTLLNLASERIEAVVSGRRVVLPAGAALRVPR